MIFEQNISERLGSIKNVMSYFERWKDELDASCIPPYTQALITTPAKDLYTGRVPHRIASKSSLYEMLQCCTSSRTVLIDRDDIMEDDKNKNKESLFSRLILLEQALLAPSLLEPVSSIIDSITPLPFVRGSETLDVVLLRISESGFEEVGIIDGGVISFVLHIDDIFDFIFKEGVKLGAGVIHKELKINGTDETDEDVLVVETNAELKNRIEREKSLSVMSPFQLSAQQFCKMYWTEVLMVVCILLDVICAIVDYSDTASDTSSNDRLQVATGIILFVFTYEAIVRVFGFRKVLLRLPFDIVDLTIVLVSVVIYVMALRDLVSADSKSVLTLTRIIRGLRMFKILKLIVGLLLRQRMMYQRDGFALDLSFITRSCVAMSRPSVAPSAGFSNPIDEVARFFTTKFPDRYVIFDLEPVAHYSPEPFGGRIERVPVEKHEPPRLVQMAAFVERVGKLADEDPKTCIAVHCKSGRDRTGVMVAAWLLYSRFAESADDAMAWFAARRIGPRAAATDAIPMPSMRRYVGYMEASLVGGGFHTPRISLRAVTLESCPNMDGRGGARLWMAVHENGQDVHSSLGGARDRVVPAGPASGGVRFEVGVAVAGDVRIAVYSREPASGRDEICCFVCFHTGFVGAGRETFPKAAVDVAAADARCKVFDRNFALVVELEPAEPASPSGGGVAAFRRIMRPSRQVVEEAARMRRRDTAVQRRFAMRLRRKVLLRTASAPSGSVTASAPAAPENLCCATGPVVEHGAVDLFRDRDGGAVQVDSVAYVGLSQLLAQSLGARIARSLVSGNKRRFVEDGFDLDLTYVTARVIAMGFPSSGIESSYRNSMADVYRFFQAKHHVQLSVLTAPHGVFQERHAAHYLIVNLCSERAYSLDNFHGNCVRYPFPDHNPPALELILPCCACIHKFLQADPDNVVAIHCKAGKGRTGLLVVAYLMYCGHQPTATDARAFYDCARTVDGKGLTIISQIRYAHYFEEQLRRMKAGNSPVQTDQPSAPSVLLHRLRMYTMPHFGGDGGCEPGATVEVKSETDHASYAVFESRSSRRTSGERQSLDGVKRRGSAFDLPAEFKDINLSAEPGVGTRVAGDFKVTIVDEARSKTMFFFWLHSAFLTSPPSDMCGLARLLTDEECAAERLPPSSWSLLLNKHEIDRAAKDTRCAHFDADFRVELLFTPLAGECGTGPALEVSVAASAVVRTESAGELPEQPLLADREAYQRYLQSLSSAGRPKLPFDMWLLSGGSDGGRSKSFRPTVSSSPVLPGRIGQLPATGTNAFSTVVLSPGI